jgi:hypothetical protein
MWRQRDEVRRVGARVALSQEKRRKKVAVAVDVDVGGSLSLSLSESGRGSGRCRCRCRCRGFAVVVAVAVEEGRGLTLSRASENLKGELGGSNLSYSYVLVCSIYKDSYPGCYREEHTSTDTGSAKRGLTRRLSACPVWERRACALLPWAACSGYLADLGGVVPCSRPVVAMRT